MTSPELIDGQTYTVTFPKAGNFKLVCLVHNNMTGAVHVLAGSEPLPHDQAFYDRQAHKRQLNESFREAVARNERAVFPVGSYIARYGVALSLPSVVGRDGVREVLSPEMSNDETRAFDRSAETLRNALATYVGAR